MSTKCLFSNSFHFQLDSVILVRVGRNDPTNPGRVTVTPIYLTSHLKNQVIFNYDLPAKAGLESFISLDVFNFCLGFLDDYSNLT